MKQKTYVGIAVAVLAGLIIGSAFIGARVDAPKMGEDDLQAKIEEATQLFFSERLKTVTVSMPDTRTEVTLVDGVASFASAPGSVSQTTVRFVDTFPVKVVQVPQPDGTVRIDVLALFEITYGGSGVFQYVALFEDQSESLAMKSIALLGDRVMVEDISTQPLSEMDGEEYMVTVAFMTRADGTPMTSAPDTATKKLFIVENGAFNLKKTDTAFIDTGKN